MSRKKADRLVRLQALRSYDLQQTGDIFLHEEDARAASLVSAGFARVVDDGTGEAGPGSAHESDPEREPQDAPEYGTESAEPGPDSGPGGHGPSEG